MKNAVLSGMEHRGHGARRAEGDGRTGGAGASSAGGGRVGASDVAGGCAPGDVVTVTGYVLPDAWGADFEVTGVLVADDRERELVVANVSEHPGLLGLCRRKVSATGCLAVKDGRLLFTVREYAVQDAGEGMPRE